MKEVFMLSLIVILTIFSGCNFDKIKNNQNLNKEAYTEKHTQKEYEEKISEAFKLIFEKKDYEKARFVLMDAMTLKDDDERLYYYFGLSDYYLKRYSDAFWSFDKAIQLDSKYDLAYQARGDLNYDLENYEEAVADYTKALKIGVSFPELTYMRRGDCYYHLGKYKEAKWDYGTVVDRDKYNAEAYFRLGMVYMDMGDEEQALKNIEKAKKLGYFKKS